jgi:hypothetical protein
MPEYCKSSKERYNLKIEQIIVSIYAVRHQFGTPIEKIMEELAIRLRTSHGILPPNQSSLSQYLNENEGVYKP